uniref:Uncharacterized protein n=1 Tax=Anguilla anguilla TaxID=7936 RepID=A0A0E9ULZ2_ANGAN
MGCYQFSPFLSGCSEPPLRSNVSWTRCCGLTLYMLRRTWMM